MSTPLTKTQTAALGEVIRIARTSKGERGDSTEKILFAVKASSKTAADALAVIKGVVEESLKTGDLVTEKARQAFDVLLEVPAIVDLWYSRNKTKIDSVLDLFPCTRKTAVV